MSKLLTAFFFGSSGFFLYTAVSPLAGFAVGIAYGAVCVSWLSRFVEGA